MYRFVDADEYLVDEALRRAGVPRGDHLTPEMSDVLLAAGLVIRSDVDERTGLIETRVLTGEVC